MSRSDEAFAKVTYHIDPSKDQIEDQHVRFAQYLKDRYLNIDVYDTEKGFYFGTCRIPLFELMRQRSETSGDKPKECEIFNPNTSQYVGYLDLILRNDGQQATESREDIPQRGPSSKDKHNQPRQRKKVMASKPMDHHDLMQARA